MHGATPAMPREGMSLSTERALAFHELDTLTARLVVALTGAIEAHSHDVPAMAATCRSIIAESTRSFGGVYAKTQELLEATVSVSTVSYWLALQTLSAWHARSDAAVGALV